MQEQLTPDFGDYELLDTGDFEKLERFGRYVTRRPEPQAIWRRSLAEEEWRRMADASFRRDARSDERGEWRLAPGMPDRWVVEYAYKRMRLRMRLGLTSFKHVGIFPEQAANWNFIYDNCRALAGDGPTDGERVAAVGSGVARGGAPKVLNLFAYTGGATLAARAAGAEVTHVDSVRQVVTWSRENMELSGLEGVRWIVEDALKFVRREVRRGSLYRGIILDPPAYGRGAGGEAARGGGDAGSVGVFIQRGVQFVDGGGVGQRESGLARRVAADREITEYRGDHDHDGHCGDHDLFPIGGEAVFNAFHIIHQRMGKCGIQLFFLVRHSRWLLDYCCFF